MQKFVKSVNLCNTNGWNRKVKSDKNFEFINDISQSCGFCFNRVGKR